VLDVGCGTGCLAAALTRRFPATEVRAVDLSPLYIDSARRTTPDPRITFEVGDACALPFAAHTFDRVLALLLLHFVPSTDRAIAEMLRVAKPGSTVAAAVWDVRGGFVANRVFFDTAAALDQKAGERRARNYTRPMTRPGELINAWRAADFADVVGTSIAIRMEFSAFEDYWTPYEGKDGPAAEYVAGLNREDRARLKEAVRLAYVDGEADGPRSYAALAWAVKGVVPA
jgi:SAM-dependent methyltransferase